MNQYVASVEKAIIMMEQLVYLFYPKQEIRCYFLVLTTVKLLQDLSWIYFFLNLGSATRKSKQEFKYKQDWKLEYAN